MIHVKVLFFGYHYNLLMCLFTEIDKNYRFNASRYRENVNLPERHRDFTVKSVKTMILKQRVPALVHIGLGIYFWFKLIDEDKPSTSNVQKPSKNKISNSFEDPR